MIKVKGLEEVSKQLNELSKRAKELGGSHSVPIDELLTTEFLSAHTRFATFEEMARVSGFKIEKQEDFAAIPDDQWDGFVRSESRFGSWEEMLQHAGEAWAARKLGL